MCYSHVILSVIVCVNSHVILSVIVCVNSHVILSVIVCVNSHVILSVIVCVNSHVILSVIVCVNSHVILSACTLGGVRQQTHLSEKHSNIMLLCKNSIFSNCSKFTPHTNIVIFSFSPHKIRGKINNKN